MTSLTITSKVFARAALTVLASGLVATVANAANAAPVDAVPTIAIHYADLNLATEQGTRALYRRIVHAANQVCDGNARVSVRQATQIQRCVDEAVAHAVDDVRSPKLAELQAARTHRVDRG